MILDDIVASKKVELENTRRRVPLSNIRDMARSSGNCMDFAKALQGPFVSIIAEIKKASPSRGIIAREFDASRLARSYATGGASAISVLTESKFFLGSLETLDQVTAALIDTPLPLLRKDFIFDRYQVYEARAHRADAILLIAAILTSQQLTELHDLAREQGMACLVEVHNESELDTALQCGASILGINNRDLRDFTVNLATTERLRPLIPPDRLVVSESGIHTKQDILRLKECGVNAVLIGEALVTAPDIAAAMRELL